MTRVNANIKPRELVDNHLSAEFFEIRRVRLYKPDLSINSFRLGKGHVKFFSTYRRTTYKRVCSINKELIKRRLIPKKSSKSLKDLFKESWGKDIKEGLEYRYKPKDNDICRHRIMESLIKIHNKGNNIKYNKGNITISDAIKLLEFETEEYKLIQNEFLKSV